MRPGAFIALEGLDGVGKTTLAQNLQGYTCMATPGPELAAVRRTIHSAAMGDPIIPQLFYAASVRAVGLAAERLRAQGARVVVDRYWLSTVAYAGARGSPLSLAEMEPHIPAADLTVLVKLAEPTRQSRLRARGMTAADTETLDPAFRERVLAIYASRGRSARAGTWMELDVTGLSVAEAVALLTARLAASLAPVASGENAFAPGLGANL